MNKQLHIVSLDIPYPADYGGAIEMFYKLPALKAAGIDIHLHCFEYGRSRQPILEKYCRSVQYYPRQQGHQGISHCIPYIVSSRINETLFSRLLEDEHPILLEGIHCAGLLLDKRFENRKTILRLHNTEHLYYGRLAGSTRQLLKKCYYRFESRLLKAFEQRIANLTHLIAISEKDVQYYRSKFEAKRINYLPPFLPYQEVATPDGLGCFSLYQGNLSVPENEKAAGWLIKEVFSALSLPFVVAGKNPSKRLQRIAAKQGNTCIVANPSETEMQDLIRKAQVNIIPSFNSTGIKLKLLNALYNGRHCLVNEAAVSGSGLAPACHLASTARAMQSILMQLNQQPLGEEEVRLRKQLLEQHYNNEQNAAQLIKWLY